MNNPSRFARSRRSGTSADSRPGSGQASTRLWLGAALVVSAALVGWRLLATDAAEATLPDGNPSHSTQANGSSAAASAASLSEHGAKAARDAAIREAAGDGRGDGPATLRFVAAANGVHTDVGVVTLSMTAIDREDASIYRDARDGVFSLSADEVGSRVAIHVRAAGYAPLRATLVPNPGENLVALHPGGTLKIRCVDADGKPVANTQLALLPPPFVDPTHNAAYDDTGYDDREEDWAANVLATPTAEMSAPAMVVRDGVWSLDDVSCQHGPMRRVAAAFAGREDWIQSSGADGHVEWRNMPAMAGFRWGLLPPHLGTVDPAHENVQYQVVDGAVRVEAPPPYGLSGLFAIRTDAAQECVATIHKSSSVRGFVRPSPDSTSAAVRLFRIVQVGGSGGGDSVGLTSYDFEGTVQVGAPTSYGFQFDGLIAGDYVVRASWMSNGRDIYYANESFSIAAGKDIDLEEVPTLSGPGHVRLRLGIQSANKLLDPATVYPGTEMPLANLFFQLLPDSQLPDQCVGEALLLPFGTEFVVHGLSAGRLLMRANAPPGQTFDNKLLSRVEAAEADTRWQDVDGTLALNLQATGGIRRSLQILDSFGLPLPAPLVWIRRCDARGHALAAPFNRAITWQPGLLGGTPTTSLNLEPGDYEIACRVVLTSSGHAGLYGSQRVRFDGSAENGGPITLRLGHCATTSGVILNADGTPAAQTKLDWRATSGGEPMEHGWPVSTTTDGEGRFSVTGLPPGAELIGLRGAPNFTGPSGKDISDLELRQSAVDKR
ncbi:MAG: hypothetical protein AB8H80_09250 [Planctomycetota bacterium]